MMAIASKDARCRREVPRPMIGDIMKRTLAALCLAATSLLLAPVASATPTLTTFGVSGNAGVFNCPWNADRTRCNWSEFQYYNGVPVHTPTGVTAIAADERGEARISGEISSTSYLPSLHAYAYSNPAATGTPGTPYGGSSVADANIWGVQGYTYNGDSPFLLTVTATLNSVFSRPNSDQQGNHSSMRVSLFGTDGYTFEYSALDPNATGREFCPIFPDAITAPGLCDASPPVHAKGFDILWDTGSVSIVMTHLLNPGESFYVGAFMDASVCCGATVDSSHSLNMVFNDASKLSSFALPGVINAVPEPASLPVALLGLGLLAGLRMRGAKAGQPGGR